MERKIKTRVKPGGRIEVTAPDLEAGQPVEVTVRPTAPTPSGSRSIVDVLAECPGGLAFKTADEVDSYLRQERDSWGD